MEPAWEDTSQLRSAAEPVTTLAKPRTPRTGYSESDSGSSADGGGDSQFDHRARAPN